MSENRRSSGVIRLYMYESQPGEKSEFLKGLTYRGNDPQKNELTLCYETTQSNEWDAM